MNPPASLRPRLVCRVVRQWCSLVDGARPRHVDACRDCQTYFAASDQLVSSLRQDAGRRMRTVPAPTDGLERQIIQAVRNAVPSPVEKRPPAWRGAWAVAAALTFAAGLTVFHRDPGPTEVATLAEAEMLTDAVELVSRKLVNSVIPSAGALVADNPLQREIDLIVGDARSALNFLALNFLPAATDLPQPGVRRS